MSQNAMMGTLFKQLSQAQIGPKFKNFCANNKTILLSTDIVQNSHFGTKLWGFEKWCGEIGQNTLTVALFEQLHQV